MKLLEQILSDLGADMANSVTFVPGSCCYLKGVKSVLEFSADKIIILTGKCRISVRGGNLSVGSFFEGDLYVTGDVQGAGVEKVQ